MHAALRLLPDLPFDLPVLEPPLLMDIGRGLAASGAAELSALRPLLRMADPGGRLSPESAHLCAALSLLATETARTLGGMDDPRVGPVAAMLALLTKLDDQHIDGPAFHAATPRDCLALETAAYLAPTLASIRSGRPESGEPRCILAAELGSLLLSLNQGPRRARLLQVIEAGWAIQVEAVCTFTAHPRLVSEPQVERVTAAITALWLEMIMRVGTLSAGSLDLSPEELLALQGWGAWIQRADALADLDKDSLDLHLSTILGRAAWKRHGESWVEAVGSGDLPGVRRLVGSLDLRFFLPTEAELDRLEAGLHRLGAVGPILRWIHGFLLARYGGPCSAP